MKIKFHWGTGIALFYSCFAAFILYLVVMSNRQQIDLVSDNYYQEGLAHQQKIETIKQTAVLPYKPVVKADAVGRATVSFPSETAAQVSGQAHFFRPSDKYLDFILPLKNIDEHTTTADPLEPGLWRVRLSWTDAGQNYFQESTLVVSKKS